MAMRAQIAKSLDWGEAHVDFDKAVDGLAAELRGRRVEHLPHSAWEILEHLRIAQHDILDFSRNPDYEKLAWPDDYWPPTPAPPHDTAWDDSVAAFKRDREEFKALTLNPGTDLTARIAHGKGQTVLREVLLVLDHN